MFCLVDECREPLLYWKLESENNDLETSFELAAVHVRAPPPPTPWGHCKSWTLDYSLTGLWTGLRRLMLPDVSG